MSLTSEITKIYVTLTSAAQTVPVGFSFTLTSDLTVVTEANVVLVEGVDYSVAGEGNAAGGSITTIPTTPNGLVIGSKLAIFRDGPLDQQTRLTNLGNFSATTVERALDKLLMQIQQVREESLSAVRLPSFEGSGGYGTTIDLKTSRFGKFLGFDSAGNLTAKDATTIGTQLTTIESNLELSKGITQAGGSPGADLVFNATNAPSVTLPEGKWILNGGATVRVSDTADTIWAQFYDSTNTVAFGGSPSTANELVRQCLPVNGSIIVGAGLTAVIHFKVFVITNTLDVGAASPNGPAGFIHATRIDS